MKRFGVAIFIGLLVALALIAPRMGADASRGFDPAWEASCRGLTSSECFTTKLLAPSHMEAWGKIDQELGLLRYAGSKEIISFDLHKKQQALKQFAQLSGGLIFPGPGTPAASGGGGYTGPGDVVSGAAAWWGLRAYNAAYATGSNPAIDLVDGSGGNPITINILATGALDIASINTWIAAHSVSLPRIVKWYDQTVHARHMVEAFASAPILTITAVGSYPAQITFSAGKQMKTGAGFAVAQPFTFVAAVNTTTSAAIQTILSDSTGAQFLINTTPAIRIQANTALNSTATLTTGTWFAVQGAANGASSIASVNASDNTGNAGANGITAGHVLDLGLDDFSEQFIGAIVEAGVWPSAVASAPMSANIRAYGSF